MPAKVDRSKDHETLLKAFNILPSNYELVFLGEGTNSMEFKKKQK